MVTDYTIKETVTGGRMIPHVAVSFSFDIYKKQGYNLKRIYLVGIVAEWATTKCFERKRAYSWQIQIAMKYNA